MGQNGHHLVCRKVKSFVDRECKGRENQQILNGSSPSANLILNTVYLKEPAGVQHQVFPGIIRAFLITLTCKNEFIFKFSTLSYAVNRGRRRPLY